MSILYPKNYFLGAPDVKAFPKVQYEKIVEIIDELNSPTGTGVTPSSGTYTITGNEVVTGQLTTSKGVLNKHTGVAANTTAAATLAVVQAGVVAGLITSTSAATVTVTLPSAAVLLAALGASAGSWYDFAIDNSAGANTVTLAVDAGATIAVTTPAITGGATLTVSTANSIGFFRIYFTSATAAKLFRLA